MKPRVLFAVLLLVVMAVGIANDKASCDRSVATRAGLNYAARYFDNRASAAEQRASLEATPRLARLDRQSAAQATQAADRLRVPQLDCSLPFPAVH